MTRTHKSRIGVSSKTPDSNNLWIRRVLWNEKREHFHILWSTVSWSSRHKHMLPSTMLNLFRWTLTPQCLEIFLETVVINFLCVLHSSNHGLRETLGKMECENLPVSTTSQLFCHCAQLNWKALKECVMFFVECGVKMWLSFILMP
jgi:hypothetical protein